MPKQVNLGPQGLREGQIVEQVLRDQGVFAAQPAVVAEEVDGVLTLFATNVDDEVDDRTVFQAAASPEAAKASDLYPELPEELSVVAELAGLDEQVVLDRLRQEYETRKLQALVTEPAR